MVSLAILKIVNEYILNTTKNIMKNNPTITPVVEIIELGAATQLTQGGQLDWFEYNRPGHPRETNDKRSSN